MKSLTKQIEEGNVEEASEIAKILHNLIINLRNAKSAVLFAFIEYTVCAAMINWQNSENLQLYFGFKVVLEMGVLKYRANEQHFKF